MIFDEETHGVQCNCHKLEWMGILCKHALKVLNYMNANIIPKSYIKKRLRKDSRNRIFDAVGQSESGSVHEFETVFVNQITSSTYALNVQCKANEITRNKLTEILDSTSEQIYFLFENLGLDDQNARNDAIHENNVRLDEKRWIKYSGKLYFIYSLNLLLFSNQLFMFFCSYPIKFRWKSHQTRTKLTKCTIYHLHNIPMYYHHNILLIIIFVLIWNKSTTLEIFISTGKCNTFKDKQNLCLYTHFFIVLYISICI